MERGSAWGVVLIIIAIIILGAAGYLGAIKFGMLTAPAGLEKVPGMAYFIPPPPPTEGGATEPVAVSGEDYLRQQVVLLNSQFQAAQTTIDSMKQQLDEKDRQLMAKDSEIADLQNSLNLAATQNISSVALIYEAMDPTEAATILTELGAEQAAIIIGQMRESKAADVLALMDSPLATQITQLMAGFQANPLAQGQGATGAAGAAPGTGGVQPGAGSPTAPSGGGGLTR
jgi:hypothetical protein